MELRPQATFDSHSSGKKAAPPYGFQWPGGFSHFAAMIALYRGEQMGVARPFLQAAAMMLSDVATSDIELAPHQYFANLKLPKFGDNHQ